MNRDYYDSVVLVTIANLLEQGQNCGQITLVNLTGFSNVTVMKTIQRLEQAGRLRVLRGSPGQRYHYEILTQPNQYDLAVADIHKKSRMCGADHE